MSTRKAWRNRAPGVNEGVLALLEIVRKGTGARSVGLFDDDRAEDPAHAPALDFRDAFQDVACGELDWDAWYRTLRSDTRVETACTCGAGHRLCGTLIHGRWVLLLVSPGETGADAAAATSSLRALADVLPPGRNPEDIPAEVRESLQRSGAPASGAGRAPLFWVRKPPE